MSAKAESEHPAFAGIRVRGCSKGMTGSPMNGGQKTVTLGGDTIFSFYLVYCSLCAKVLPFGKNKTD